MTYPNTNESGRRLIRLAAVQHRTGLSRTGVYARIADGTFPDRVPIGGRAVAWVESEVDEWIASRIEQRAAKAPTTEAAA